MSDTEIHQSNQKDSGASGHSLKRLLILLVSIVAIAAVVSFVWSLVPDKYKAWQPSSPLWETYSAMRGGDLQGALATFKSIQDDPTASADERASAVLVTLGAQNRISGDPSQILIDVQNLKQAIRDEGVTPPVRARLISALAAQYTVAGNSAAVFAEIFKDAPFSTYLAPEDVGRSTHNLYQWSYTISPTALAAINLARWYSEPVVSRTGHVTWTMTDADAERAEKSLLEADTLASQETTADSQFISGSQYYWYRYWRTIVIARLADKIGEPYKNEYRAEFDEFISFTLAHPAALAKENLLYTRFQFAIWLLQNDDDTRAATQQLDTLAQELPTLPYPDSNSFVLAVRNAHANNQGGALWHFTSILAKISPRFKGEVERLIGAPVE